MREGFDPAVFPQQEENDTDNIGSRKINRRRILQISVLGSAGMMFAPLLSDVAEAQGRNAVHQYVYWFAQQIGLQKLDDNIDDYIAFLQNRGEAGWAKQMQIAKNRMTAGRIFTDASVSAVYAHERTVFFPMRSNESAFNACAPFVVNGRFVNAMSEGPTLIGLALAARSLRTDGNGAEEARELLFATQGVQPSIGSFNGGYTQVEQYKTKGGVLGVDYNVTKYDPATKSGEGEILVKAERDLRTGGREVALKKEWDITFKV